MLRWLRIVSVFAFFVSFAHAQDDPGLSRHLLRKRLSGDLRALLRAENGRVFFVRVPTPEGLLRFRLRRAPLPSSVAYFRDRSQESAASFWRHAVLFKGYYVDRRRISLRPVTADIIGETLRFTFFGPLRGRPYSVEQRVAAGRPEGPFKIATRPSTLRLLCGAAAPALAAGERRSAAQGVVSALEYPPPPALSPRRVLELSASADYEFFRAYGRNAVAQMEALVNSADALMSKQLGLVVRPRSFHAFTSAAQPYLSSASFSLLTEFRSYAGAARPMAAADVYHLFTGKTLGEGIIGLGYVAQICQENGKYAYSLSQRYLPALQALVLVHELGHNLGAHHPEEILSSPPSASLMTGVVQPANDTFSQFSIDEIVDYVRRDGGCLGAAQ